MAQYIDKSAVMAEIERRLEALANTSAGDNREFAAIIGAQHYELLNLGQYINTLEYKDGEIVESQKPLYKVGNIIEYKGHYYYIKEVVKNKERGFHYNLIAVDGGEVISIGPASEKDIILISNNRFDYEHANIQQKDFSPKASTANRQLYNRAILKILSDYVEKYPDTRFVEMFLKLKEKNLL